MADTNAIMAIGDADMTVAVIVAGRAAAVTTGTMAAIIGLAEAAAEVAAVIGPEAEAVAVTGPAAVEAAVATGPAAAVEAEVIGRAAAVVTAVVVMAMAVMAAEATTAAGITTNIHPRCFNSSSKFAALALVCRSRRRNDRAQENEISRAIHIDT